jgi:hypothetical protein
VDVIVIVVVIVVGMVVIAMLVMMHHYNAMMVLFLIMMLFHDYDMVVAVAIMIAGLDLDRSTFLGNQEWPVGRRRRCERGGDEKRERSSGEGELVHACSSLDWKWQRSVNAEMPCSFRSTRRDA